jgi:outer membrane protein OmpA-like peptidoglycan-associated protein
MRNFNRKFFIFWLLVLCFLFQHPSQLSAQTTASIVAKLVNTVESDISKAQSEQVNLLSPNEFAEAFKNFELAKDDDARGKDQKGILKKLNTAQEHLANAFNHAKVSRTVFTELLAAREAALDAAAPQYASALFEEAETIFRAAATKVEDGNTKSASERAGKATEGYQNAELQAIKASIIGKVHLLLKKAKENRAEKYAPITYLRSQTLLQEAENILNSDRNKQSLARKKAEEAEYEANHAMYLTRIALENAEEDTRWETYILEQEDMIKNIGKEFTIDEMQYENGSIKSVNQIRQAIQSLKSNLKNLQEELHNKNKEIASGKEDLRDLRLQLDKSQAEKIGLEDELEAKRRREEKIKRVENIFSVTEAKVIREGNTLKIRLVGLTFGAGKSVIDPEFFNLLTKVQQAIREFSDSPIRIEGHTDSKGHAAANDRLSTARADAVRAYLLANMGLPEGQVQAVGYGAARPIAPDTSEEERRQNRRIDILMDISKLSEY